MPVTDREVAALRAMLVQDWDGHRRLMDQLSERATADYYLPLLTSAFFEAVEHRFRGKKRSEMIEWVADVRAQTDPGNRIDPDVAERLILAVFGKASTDGLEFETRWAHQGILLTLLVEEQRLDGHGLDSFLAKARADADAAVA